MPPNLIRTKIVCTYSIDQKNTLKYSRGLDTNKCHFQQRKSSSKSKYTFIYCLECCVEIWSMGLWGCNSGIQNLREEMNFKIHFQALVGEDKENMTGHSPSTHWEQQSPGVPWSLPHFLGSASMELFQTKFDLQGGLWEIFPGSFQVCSPLVEMALAHALLQTEAAHGRWGKRSMSQGESGSYVICELHRSHLWQDEASWTWAAFPWAGK